MRNETYRSIFSVSKSSQCRHAVLLQKGVQGGEIKFARLRQHFMMKLGNLGAGRYYCDEEEIESQQKKVSWLGAAWNGQCVGSVILGTSTTVPLVTGWVFRCFERHAQISENALKKPGSYWVWRAFKSESHCWNAN